MILSSPLASDMNNSWFETYSFQGPMRAAFSEVEHAVPDWVQDESLGTSDQKVNHNVPIKCRAPPIKVFKASND